MNLFTGRPISHFSDPAKTHISSFTRFVLPFAYDIGKIDEQPPSSKEPILNYRRINFDEKSHPEWLSFIKRKRYFTRETAQTLYQRAIWLEANPDQWANTEWGREEVEITLRKKKYNIGMSPPRVVLFEANDGDVAKKLSTISKQTRDCSALSTGFIYVDIYFAEPKLDVKNTETITNKPALDDFLILNEFFRYSTVRDEYHAEQFREILGNVPVAYELKSKGKKNRTISDFGKDDLQIYFERWAKLLDLPILEDAQLYRLVSEADAMAAREYVNHLSGENTGWMIYADNRTYTWTCAVLKDGGKALREKLKKDDKKSLHASDYGHWLRLLNIDQPIGSIDVTDQGISEFESSWLHQHTYKRWEEDGTWYGFTYHSGAVLGPGMWNVFWPSHSYYFDASMLLFYLRLTLFRFSAELSDVVSHEVKNEASREQIRLIREAFSRFSILYQFPMVSNQQQAMEMFKLARERMELDEFFDQVQTKIDKTHDFLELVESTELSKSANKLARWGLPLAAIGTTAAMMSMVDHHFLEWLQVPSEWSVNVSYLIQIIAALLAGLVTTILLNKVKTKGR